MKAPEQMTLMELLGNPAAPQLQMSQQLMPEISSEMFPPDFFDENEEDDYEDQIEPDQEDFQRNLAEDYDDHFLEQIASELLQKIEDDENSRQPWMEMIQKVKEQIGLGEDSSYEEPFPGASSVVYPIITKAQIQFQSRALPEIFPNNPAKAVVIGDSTPELDNKADRVSDVLNYQITWQDRGNKKDFRKMLWWLPLTGSTFRYVYHDPLKNINMVRFVPVEDFIVPYATVSLEDAPHFTHRFFDSKNTIKKLINAGFYRDTPIFDASSVQEEVNAAQKIRDAGDGKTFDVDNAGVNAMQECFYVYTDYDFEEDVDDNGEPTGIGLPYVFTIHSDTKKILAIRRNWKSDDPLKQKRIFYVHYQYQEGPGFYGSGLPHLIGSLQEAATGALRAFGDAMAFSLLKGGWKLKDAKFSGSEVFSPGHFQDVDGVLDDINKGIKIADFAPPPMQALEYIKMLADQAQTIVSTQDIMTGDAMPQNAPVGTTLAIIEQAQKIITAQHQSLYQSFSEELKILADLNYDFLPDNANFMMPGKVGVIQRSDFDGSIDVQPTADPTVASFQIKQAINQALMQLGQVPQFQPFFRDNGFELFKRIIKDLNVPAPDEVTISDDEFKQKQMEAAQNPTPPSPEEQKAQAEMAQMQQQMQLAQGKAQADAQSMKLDVQLKQQEAQQNAQLAQAKLQIEQQKIQLEQQKLQAEQELQKYKIDLEAQSKAAAQQMDLQMKAQLEQQKIDMHRDMELLQFALQADQHVQGKKKAKQDEVTQQKDGQLSEVLNAMKDNMKKLVEIQSKPRSMKIVRDDKGNIVGGESDTAKE